MQRNTGPNQLTVLRGGAFVSNKELAPVCLFAFNRIDETKRTIDCLKNNFLAAHTEVIVFSDGARNNLEKLKVDDVRNFLSTVSGFKKFTIIESSHNKGLANSIIEGVTRVLEAHESVIVLEDDLVTSRNFLNFMNGALKFYEGDENIFSVSGYTLNLPSLPGVRDIYFGRRASSWGWGIWKNRWDYIDWEVPFYSDFKKNKNEIKRFKKGGSDLPRMLRNQMEGRIDSWAIRFCFHQFQKDLMTVFPTTSKVESIGFTHNATHTYGSRRFLTQLDSEESTKFRFEKYDHLDPKLEQEFAKKFSLSSRLLNQLESRFVMMKQMLKR